MNNMNEEELIKELYWLEDEYNQLDKELKEATAKGDKVWLENLEYKKEYLDRHLKQAKKNYERNKNKLEKLNL